MLSTNFVKMRKLLTILSITTIALFVSSCETDIDVNAEYKDIPVVYGLINPLDTNHYIKINKAFIGEGNAYDLAAIESNFNYDPNELDVVIEEITPNGDLVNTFLPDTTTSITKDEGIFDNSKNILYKFTTTFDYTGAPSSRLNTFKLSIYNKTEDKEITGETQIVKESFVVAPSKGSKFQFWNGDIATGQAFTKSFEVNPGEDVGRVELIMVFNYIEHYTIASGKAPQNKSIKMNLGEQKTVPMTWELDGETFFENVDGAVSAPSSVADFSHRELANISMIVNIAGTELSTFMDVEAPTSSVNQEKPDYTNLENALGILSSRELVLWESTIGGGQVNIQNSTISYLQSLNKGFCFGIGGTAVAPCNQL